MINLIKTKGDKKNDYAISLRLGRDMFIENNDNWWWLFIIKMTIENKNQAFVGVIKMAIKTDTQRF